MLYDVALQRIVVVAHDISFKVVGCQTDGTNTILYEASKVERDSGWTNVKGFQSITLNFDNTASLLRRKQVQIAVDLVS